MQRTTRSMKTRGRTDRTGRPHADHGRRLSLYAAAAVAGGAGIANAAVVDSGSWAGWTGTAGGTVGGGPYIDSQTTFGSDTLINGAFAAQAGQGSGFGLFRWGRFSAATPTNAQFAVGRQAGGAVLGSSLPPASWTTNTQGTVNLAFSIVTNNSVPWQPVGALGWSMSTGTAADSVHGYLGFRISDGDSDFYYGYFEVTMSRTGTGYDGGGILPDVGTPSTISMTIHGWAYENVAGQSITIPGAAAVPGGAGLAALACGAAGLRGRRRTHRGESR